MEKKSFMNIITQFALPIMTIGVQLAIALKYPQWGLVINFISQPFWLYSAWKSYKQAGQIGMFITTIIVTIIIAAGIINYWFIK